MECKRQSQSKSVKIDERSVKEQEYRKLSRIWERVVRKHSSTTMAMGEMDDESKKEVRFRSSSSLARCQDEEGEEESADASQEMDPITLQRKMAKMKSFGKKKSPLQKFDEIVTREVLNRQSIEDEGLGSFDATPCSKFTPSGKKLTFDTKVSKTLMFNAERELSERDKELTDFQNEALMDAIDRLIQAQASCRFDAAVKAAEAAASSVPPELAEEVAITCARDYQSQIIDIVNEKVGGGDGKKPIEVIGYIGITNKKEVLEDE